MALKLTEKERKRLYYLEHQEEIKKEGQRVLREKRKTEQAEKGDFPAKALLCLIYWSRK